MTYTNTTYDDLLEQAEEQLDRWREIRKSLRIMKKQETQELTNSIDYDLSTL